jgi:hypothetical protein
LIGRCQQGHEEWHTHDAYLRPPRRDVRSISDWHLMQLVAKGSTARRGFADQLAAHFTDAVVALLDRAKGVVDVSDVAVLAADLFQRLKAHEGVGAVLFGLISSLRCRAA